MLDLTSPDIVMVKLPKGFRFLNQFAPSQWAKDPSKMLCVETSITMADEFQRPGDHIPEHLIEVLCSDYVGPDVASNPNGTTLDEARKMFAYCKLTYIDLQSLVDEFNRGNRTPLHAEIMAQNNQNVLQIFTVNDESKLFEAVANPDHDPQNPYVHGKKLHAWDDVGMSHTFVRVGYSKINGFGLYGEPAAVGFAQPVPILWQDIVNAGIIHAWAVLPEGVAPPPADFLFQHGTWPAPKPAQITVDQQEINDALAILKATTNTVAQGIVRIEELLGIKAS